MRFSKFSGFVLINVSRGLVNAFGVFQTYYSTGLLPGSSNTQISWIGSLCSFLLAASPIIFGPVYDRGYPRLLAVSGSFLVVFGLMMTSLCTQYWQLILAQGVCVGLGGGCIFITAVATVGVYFTRRRALAIGIAASGSSLGGIIYPIAFHRLQPRVGFPWAVRIIGFIALGTLALSSTLLKPRIPSGSIPRRPLLDFSILRDKTFDVFNIATFFGFIGQYVPFFYVEEYSREQGMSPNLSFYMLVFLSTGSIFGRIVPGLIADKTSPSVVLAICTGCAAILSFCWIEIKSTAAGLTVFCLLYGFFSGAFVSLQPASVASMTEDMSTIGARLGMNAFFAALGILIGNPVAGAIVPKSWAGTQVFCGATLALSTSLLVATKMLLARPRKVATDEKPGVQQHQ